MNLSDRLSELIQACFSGLWVQSYEHEDALAEIAAMCHKESWHLAIWDVADGFQIPGQTNAQSVDAEGADPLAAIRALNAMATPDGSAILVLVNFHRFLNSPEIIQAVAKQILAGKHNRTFLVILSPLIHIPPELEKQILVVDQELPTREQVKNIFSSMCPDNTSEFPEGPERESILSTPAIDIKRFC
jgi:hypothetical protein